MDGEVSEIEICSTGLTEPAVPSFQVSVSAQGCVGLKGRESEKVGQ